MTQQILAEIAQKQLKTDLPKLSIGDTVDVHVRIIEGAKERVQIFNGVIIAMSGSGVNRMITVRRIVANEGVERVFPLHSPRISKIEVNRHGHVRRSKLYYLRERVGKKRRLHDRRRGLEQALTPPPPEAAPEAPEAAKVAAQEAAAGEEVTAKE